MFFKKKKPRWEPLKCMVSDVTDVIENGLKIAAPLMKMTFSYHDQEHVVGVDIYNEEGKYDFVLDDQRYTSYSEFQEHASINGQRFVDISEPIALIKDEYTGNPRGYTMLAKREIIGD